MPYAGTDLAGCGSEPAGLPTPNGDADADAEINVISHEQIETVNDPQLNAWYDAAGYEIADKCASSLGAVAADGGNVTLTGQRFLVQQEFSNVDNACVIKLAETMVAIPYFLTTAPGVIDVVPVHVRNASRIDDYGYTGTVTITTSDPLASSVPATYTYQSSDRGAYPFYVTLWTPGRQTVTATDATNGLQTTTTITVVRGGVDNGGFEAGLTGWTRVGASTTTNAAHSGVLAARVGAPTPTLTATLAQAFTAPYGATQLHVWYRQACNDTLKHDWATVTLKDVVLVTTRVMLAKTCTNNGLWTEVTAPIQAGRRYRLTLLNHDNKVVGTASSTAFDDISTS
jgi:hypothetical protein